MMCLCMTSWAQNAQLASNTASGETNYSIVMSKDAMTRMLSLTAPMANKMDAWQNALQEKIDEAVKLYETGEQSATLRNSIAESLVSLKDMLGSESYNKYLTVFRNTIKNRHIEDLMK